MSNTTKTPDIELSKFTRLNIIDRRKGRDGAATIECRNVKLSPVIQDDGRTLKIVMEDRMEAARDE